MPPPRASSRLRARRRAVRPLGLALPLAALALVAAGCGSSLGGRYDSATTTPRRGAGDGRDPEHAARGDGAAAAVPRSGLREHAAVARRRERALHAARPLRGRRGPARHRDRPGPRARSADRFARQSHVPRAAAGRAALRRRPPPHDRRTCAARSSACSTRSRDLPGATLFYDIVGAKDFAPGTTPRLRGVRATGGQITFTLKRSDPAFLARLAMPIACPVESSTPHRRCPGCSRSRRPGATASSSTPRR